MVRQSEFKLADLEYTQGVEVDRWAIELSSQQQIANMIQPPKNYYDTENEQPKPEPEFSRTATGFLAWLQQKAEKLGNNFEVRWCGMQSFSGKKPTKEEIMTWVAELVNVELAYFPTVLHIWRHSANPGILYAKKFSRVWNDHFSSKLDQN